MKRILAGICLGLFLTGAAVSSGETPVPAPIPEGMGTKVEIGSTVDMSGVDRSYLDAGDIVNLRSGPWINIILTVVMSPDGGQVYFGGTSDGNIYAVPAGGGTPRVLFESYQIYPYQEKRYVVNQGACDLVGITADGRYLYFIRAKYDGVTITNGGAGYTLSAGKRFLERLDLQTGEAGTIHEGAEMAVMSASGKYVACTDAGLNTYVIDTDTQEKWLLPIPRMAEGFIQDTYVFYRQADGDGVLQFFRIPILGGEPEQITRVAGGFNRDSTPSCSPDGKWMIFTRWTGESHSNSITLPGGGTRSYTKGVMKLCALDLRSGVVSDVLPMSKTVDPRFARFFTDGSRFSYILENDEGSNFHQEWSIYIHDFDPESLNPNGPVAVEEAAPVAFGLTGNRPNPFNPSTTIGFTLPETGAARLTVYDITGRKVRELVSGTLPAGKHEITWDGRDDAGVAVSSGVYLSRLNMGSMTSSGRMLLVK